MISAQAQGDPPSLCIFSMTIMELVSLYSQYSTSEGSAASYFGQELHLAAGSWVEGAQRKDREMA